MLKSAKTLGRFVSAYALAIALTAVSYAAAPPQAKPGKEYINRKEGFRLRLPRGWRELKGDKVMSSLQAGPGNVVTAFESRHGSFHFIVVIEHLFPVPTSQDQFDEFLVRLDQDFKDEPLISEGELTLSGLPARKVIYDHKTFGSRDWVIRRLDKNELWQIRMYPYMDPRDFLRAIISLPEEPRLSPENPGYQEAQQIVDSFEFLEPVLSRLKAAPPITVAAGGFRGRELYWITNLVGIRLLAPPEWQVLVRRVPTSFATPAVVVLGFPGTLAQVELMRHVLEASHETYRSLSTKSILDQSEEFRELGEQQLMNSGLTGNRLVLSTKRGGVWTRFWLHIFSADKVHYVIVARAPEEAFERYEETFQKMMESVEFPGYSLSHPF